MSERIHIRDIQYMLHLSDAQIAFICELASTSDRQFHIAYVAINGKLVCYATNEYFLGTTAASLNKYSIHAEVKALCKYRARKPTGNAAPGGSVDLYVLKISKMGFIGQSAPCVDCTRHLLKMWNAFRIRQIIHSTMNGLEVIKRRGLEDRLHSLSCLP